MDESEIGPDNTELDLLFKGRGMVYIKHAKVTHLRVTNTIDFCILSCILHIRMNHCELYVQFLIFLPKNPGKISSWVGSFQFL